MYIYTPYYGIVVSISFPLSLYNLDVFPIIPISHLSQTLNDMWSTGSILPGRLVNMLRLGSDGLNPKVLNPKPRYPNP